MISTRANKLRWDLTGPQILQLAQEIEESFQQKLDHIVQIPEKDRTFENTFKALSYLDAEFSTKFSSCSFPAHVAVDKQIRDAATEATTKLERFSIEMETREDVYNALVQYRNTHSQEIAALDAQSRRLINKTLKNFERNGLGLSEDKQKRVKEIKQKLSELSIQFQQNLNEENTKLQFSKEELDGLPDDFLENLPREGEKYVVSLKYPELLPVIEQCKVESTRKSMDFANSSKCIKENTPLLEETLLLRQEEAKLLGFQNHANYILDIRMAKNAENVFNFLNDLIAKLDAPSKRDMARLLELKRSEVGSADKLHVYDWRYYDHLLLQKEYQVDHDVIKEYFPLEKVISGCLEIYQDLLSLKFVEMSKSEANIWHDDVKQYQVFDRDTNNFLGQFYLDLFPRDGKYGHAAKFDLQPGCEVSANERQPSIAAVVCNFTKPTSTKPSLLKFDEVETFFHEFGHAMHDICTTARYCQFSGTRVERDFVEAPSQMLENWCYEKEVLMRISGHYKDQSRPLPEELRERLIKARYVNEAFKNRRQLHFGKFDMIIHTTEGPVDTASLWAQSMDEVALTPAQPGTNGAVSFAHIMAGYSAGYYGYLWSKVFSSDMFARFKKEGIMNPVTGKAYRDLILAPGGSRDAMDCLKEFLGREPQQDAFLEEIGAK